MEYTSTRDNSVSVESAVAIAKGISDDGGLLYLKAYLGLQRGYGRAYRSRLCRQGGKILGMYLDL